MEQYLMCASYLMLHLSPLPFQTVLVHVLWLESLPAELLMFHAYYEYHFPSNSH